MDDISPSQIQWDTAPAGGPTPTPEAPHETPAPIAGAEDKSSGVAALDSMKPVATPEPAIDPSQIKWEQPDALEPVYAAAQGISEGLTGPVGTWLAKRLGETKEQHEGLQARNPISHGTGELVGLGAGLLSGTGVGGLAIKAGEAIPAIEGAGYLARVGNSALKQAAEMAVISSSDEASKMLVDPERSAETALSNIGLSTAIGAGTGTLITGAISPIWNATVGDALSNKLKSMSLDTATKMAQGAENSQLNPIVKKVLSTFGGVSDKDIDAYLAHHDAIQKIPEFQEIYEHALDHVGSIHDAVETGKMSVMEAKSAYKDMERSFSDMLRQNGADASTANKLAQQALKDGQTKLTSDLLQQALAAGEKAAGATDALHTRVVKGSSKAYEALEASQNDLISLDGFHTKAEALAKDLEAEGTLEARAQAERIRSYSDNIKTQYEGGQVTGPQAKQMIQGLDKVSKYDYNASAFDKGLSSAYKQLRRDLDTTLKDAVPEYRAAMKPVAKDVELLTKLKRYGTPEGATTRIKSLKNPDVYKNEMGMLRELEERTGLNFTHEIEPYANPEMRAKLTKALPEFDAAEKAAADLEDLKSPRAKKAMEELIATSEEAKALQEAQEQLARATAAKDTIKGVTPQTLQGKLTSVATPGKSIANEAILSQIPGMEGKTLPELMNLLRIREAFSKNATRGSKHVNLYGMLMGALGSMVGHGMPLAEMGGGAALGAFVDNNGPTIVKKILDKAMDDGIIGKLLKSNPESIKTMVMKTMAHDGEVSAEGFKAGVDYLNAIRKGDVLISNAIKHLIAPGDVLKSNQKPSAQDREKLDKAVVKHQEQPNDLNKINKIVDNKVGGYLPEQHAAVTEAVARQLSYLQTLKPFDKPGMPLDKPIPPSTAEVARYNRALDIANQPAVVLQHIKDGTLQVTDIKDLNAMYPALYKDYSRRILEQVAEHKHNEEPIPYKTRIGISMFLGQPIDSTMSPSSIMAAQPKPQGPPQQPQGAPMKGRKGAGTLGKHTNSMYQTPGQAAEKDRSGRD